MSRKNKGNAGPVGVLPKIDVSTAQNLRLRVYPDDALPQEVRPFLLTRPLAPGLIESVVLDYADSMRPINRTEVTDHTAAYAKATGASIRDEESYVKHQEHVNVPFLVIGGTHRYVTAHLHVLKRYTGTAPYGALVGMPLPEYLVIHVIGSETSVARGMLTMQDVAEAFFDDGERAITPQLYWWRPGRHESLPEDAAFASGSVPDLRPVGVHFDRATNLVDLLTPDTGELFRVWETARA